MPNNLDQILREYSAEVIDTVFTYQDDDRKPNQLYSDVQAEEGRVKAQIAEAIEHIIGEDDRDYSHDNADTESLKLLIAMSSAVNEEKSNQRERAKVFLGEFLESSNELPKQENSLPN